MKAITILNKIKKEQACSIHTSELLNKALKREKKLREKEAIRFRPLYGDFDIVNADYLKNGLKEQYMAPMTFDDLYKIFS